mmetsp:Transcript_59656/g.129706  ORF Transcript_59656/g.129706 Transcript_59656/m.129706 type:complete len:456 (-) Transcript_59656:728-2095(-)
MHSVVVALVEQALLEELCGTVGDHAVTLHLSEPQTTVSPTTLEGLPGQDLHFAAGARVDLVVDHMLESLVVRRAEENGCDHPATCLAVVHDLRASLLVSASVQLLGNVLDRHLDEGRGVGLLTDDRPDLSHNTFDNVTNGHARGYGVWVHDNVGSDSLTCERHVLLLVCDSTSSFLSVTRGEFVADLGDANRAHSNLDELEPRVGVGGEHDLVNHANLVVTRTDGLIQLDLLVALELDDLGLADDHVVLRHADTRRAQPVLVDLVVVDRFQHLALLPRRPFELFQVLRAAAVAGPVLLLHKGTIKTTPEETTVDGALVHDDRVFLVVAAVAGDGDDGVLARRELVKMEVVHCVGFHKGLLRVEKHVSEGIHAEVVVGDVNPHGLLAHSALVGVSRGLVVVRERDDGATNAQDDAGVDLTVGVLVRVAVGAVQIVDKHGDHARLLLLGVNELNESL